MGERSTGTYVLFLPLWMPEFISKWELYLEFLNDSYVFKKSSKTFKKPGWEIQEKQYDKDT